MKKFNLGLEAGKKVLAELEKNGVIITKPIPNIPEGLYSGEFVTQEIDGKTDIVMNVIDYERNEEQRAFPQILVNIVNTKTGDKYQRIGIALSDEVENIISKPENLKLKYDFRAEKGRVRTFLSLAS